MNDYIKETISNYRFGLGALIGIMVALISGLSSSVRDENYDILFWVGILTLYIIFFSFIILINKMIETTNELKEKG